MIHNVVYVRRVPCVIVNYEEYWYERFLGDSLTNEPLYKWVSHRKAWKKGEAPPPPELWEITRPVRVYDVEYIASGDNGYPVENVRYEGEALYYCPEEGNYLITSMSHWVPKGYYEAIEQDNKLYLLFDGLTTPNIASKLGAIDFLYTYGLPLTLLPKEVSIS